MKNDVQKYIERMKYYNKYEETVLRKNISPEKKIRQYIALMEFAYEFLPAKKIKVLEKKSTQHSIDMQQKMMLIFNKKFS
jgi:hypothetical protein